MTSLKFLTIALLILTSVHVVAAEPAADPRENLATAIPEAIRLLEQKEYATLFKSFVRPDELEAVTKKTPLKDILSIFAERKGPQLLAMLQEIKDKQPTMNEAKTTASYNFKEPIGGKQTIEFIKVDKYWYLKN